MSYKCTQSVRTIASQISSKLGESPVTSRLKNLESTGRNSIGDRAINYIWIVRF